MAAITRMKANEKKVVIMIILVTVLVLRSIFCEAQIVEKDDVFFKGFETSFGIRSFTLTSDIAVLKNLSVIEEGGRVGVLWGNRAVITKLGAGFFYSASCVPQTVDLFESDASVNVYPLALINKEKSSTIEPYLTAGLIYGIMKFSGTYLNRESSTTNYSLSKEPYLGNCHQLQSYLGTGVEFRLTNDHNFAHLYSELNYGVGLAANKQTVDFNGTSAGNQLIVNLGVRFGVVK